MEATGGDWKEGRGEEREQQLEGAWGRVLVVLAGQLLMAPGVMSGTREMLRESPFPLSLPSVSCLLAFFSLSLVPYCHLDTEERHGAKVTSAGWSSVAPNPTKGLHSHLQGDQDKTP